MHARYYYYYYYYYSIAPRIPPGRVEGHESLKADILIGPVVVVDVVVARAVIYRCVLMQITSTR